MTQTRAYLKSIRLSPIKAGLVADAVRGKHVQEALDFLTFSKKKSFRYSKEVTRVSNC